MWHQASWVSLSLNPCPLPPNGDVPTLLTFRIKWDPAYTALSTIPHIDWLPNIRGLSQALKGRNSDLGFTDVMKSIELIQDCSVGICIHYQMGWVYLGHRSLARLLSLLHRILLLSLLFFLSSLGVAQAFPSSQAPPLCLFAVCYFCILCRMAFPPSLMSWSLPSENPNWDYALVSMCSSRDHDRGSCFSTSFSSQKLVLTLLMWSVNLCSHSTPYQ